MKVLEVVGWDNGYDYEKIIVGASTEDKIKYPSVIYKPSSSDAIFNVTSKNIEYGLNKMILQYKGEEYFIGDYAIEQDPMGGTRNFEDDKFKDDSEIVKLLAGLSALYPDENEIKIKNLMVGLSLSTYKQYKDVIVNKYKNIEIIYSLPNKKGIKLVIENVVCIPQGVGAFYDELLSIDGNPVNDRLIDTRYGLIDVGGKTVDAFISHGIYEGQI